MADMQILLCEPADVHQPFGHLEYRAYGPCWIGAATGLPDPVPRFCCGVPLLSGGWWLYGWQQWTEGGIPHWAIVRARTFDGLQYEGFERLHQESGAHWLGMTDIARNPDTGQLLMLKWARGQPGHALWAYGSDDGRTWHGLADHPVYCDHDSFGMIWEPSLQRYVVHQATYEPWHKPFADNIGDSKRRVTHIRTSPDGLVWDPPDDVGFSGPYAAPERLLVPGRDDPPELEFYRMRAFPYSGRYAASVLLYAASPQPVNPHAHRSRHGPQLACEWWMSDDAITWRRPYRRSEASGDMPGPITHEPIEVAGELRFLLDRQVYALPRGRLAGVFCRANGQFSTQAFDMPASPLALNVSAGHTAGPRFDMHTQAYVMAELTDEAGGVLSGYERSRCAVQDVDCPDLPLRWDGADGTDLAGMRVRLRLCFRDATVYGVSAA